MENIAKFGDRPGAVVLVDEAAAPVEADRPAKARGAFTRFPNAVARDRAVEPETLVYSAWRATFADDMSTFKSDEAAIVKAKIVSDGFGKNVVRRAIASACSLGFQLAEERQGPRGPILARPQKNVNGCFEKVEETFGFPPSPDGFSIVYRNWFDGTLSLKAMAVRILLNAGIGKGPWVYAREVAARFDWKVETATKYLNELHAQGLVIIDRPRGKKGRFDGVRYRLGRPAKSGKFTATRNPGTGNPGTGKSGSVEKERKTALNGGLPSTDDEEKREVLLSDRQKCLPDDPRKPWEGVEFKWSAIADHSVEELLSELETYEYGAGERIEEAVDAEHLDAIDEVIDDDTLAVAISQATEQRINQDMLSDEGLDTARWLAAALMAHSADTDYALTAAEAIDHLLDALSIRIGGRPGEWLNSWSLIGRRLSGYLKQHEAYYGGLFQEKTR